LVIKRFGKINIQNISRDYRAKGGNFHVYNSLISYQKNAENGAKSASRIAP
jgi:hypothetical protein